MVSVLGPCLDDLGLFLLFICLSEREVSSTESSMEHSTGVLIITTVNL